MNLFGGNGSPEHRNASRSSSSASDADKDANRPGRFLGSLRDALAAASRNDAGIVTGPPVDADIPPPTEFAPAPAAAAARPEQSADPAARMREPTPPADNSTLPPAQEVTLHLERARAAVAPARADAARTELLRGRNPVPRGDFRQDPVVGWLVVVGGLGLGSFRPVFEGNNSIGRARSQRIAIDFGDEAISNEEQAYIRYDGNDRTFLFVPNMSKTNVVSVNNKKPTSAVPLNAMDVITMGRTQLAFVPFCGPEFDWSEI